MAQQAVRAGVRAVKSSRKFVPRKAAVVMVSRKPLKSLFDSVHGIYAISYDSFRPRLLLTKLYGY